MKKNNNVSFHLTIKDLKKIKYICQAFEDLCEAVVQAEWKNTDEELKILKTLVEKYNTELEKGDI